MTLDKQKMLVVQNKSLKNSEESQDLIESSVVPTKTTDSNGTKESHSTNGSFDSDDVVEEEEEEEEYTESSDEEEDIENGTEEGDTESDMDEEEVVEESSSADKSGVKRKREEASAAKNIKFGDETVKNFATGDSITGPLPVLPGVSSFFNPHDEQGDRTSSDEEEEVR